MQASLGRGLVFPPDFNYTLLGRVEGEKQVREGEDNWHVPSEGPMEAVGHSLE